jgi:hypothetical protein
LRRLQVEVQAYHSQLEGKPGFQETSVAVEALKKAAREIELEHGSLDDNDLG